MPTQVINEDPRYVHDLRHIIIRESKNKSYEVYTVVEEVYDAPGSEGMAFTLLTRLQHIQAVNIGDPLHPLTEMLYLNQQAMRHQVKQWQPIPPPEDLIHHQHFVS